MEYLAAFLLLVLGFVLGSGFGCCLAGKSKQPLEVIYTAEAEQEQQTRRSLSCTVNYPCRCCQLSEVFAYSNENRPCTSYCNSGSCNYRNCTYEHATHGLCQMFRSIDKARRRIDVCVFHIDSDEIADKLLEVKQRQVELRIICDASKSGDEQQDLKRKAILKRLADGGARVRVRDSKGLMHNKFLLVDGRKVIHGSPNLSWSASHLNDETIVISEQPSMVAKFNRIFNRLFQTYQPLPADNGAGAGAGNVRIAMNDVA